jgi:hypothetical protein
LRIRASSFLAGLPTREWFMLDLFAGKGTVMSLDFARAMRRSVLCELDEDKLRILRLNGMDVRGCLFRHWNSYTEAHLYGNTVDFVNADNPSGLYGGHCENFDVPAVAVEVLRPHGFLATNIHVNPYAYSVSWFLTSKWALLENGWDIFSGKIRYREWFRAREQFYGRNVLSLAEASEVYRLQFSALGWDAKVIRSVKRAPGLWYVLFEMRRMGV